MGNIKIRAISNSSTLISFYRIGDLKIAIFPRITRKQRNFIRF